MKKHYKLKNTPDSDLDWSYISKIHLLHYKTHKKYIYAICSRIIIIFFVFMLSYRATSSVEC